MTEIKQDDAGYVALSSFLTVALFFFKFTNQLKRCTRTPITHSHMVILTDTKHHDPWTIKPDDVAMSL